MRRHLLLLACLPAVALALACAGSDSTDTDPTAQPQPAVRAVGGACYSNGELTCALDQDAGPTGDVLECRTGVYAKAFACGAGEECGTQEGHRSVRCGSTYFALPGGACPTAGSAACSPDRAAVVVCVDGAWLSAHHCAPTTCGFVKGKDGVARAQCGADDVYAVGDYCDFPAGTGVCSVDHAAVLACVGKKTVVDIPCEAPKKCGLGMSDAGVGVTCQ